MTRFLASLAAKFLASRRTTNRQLIRSKARQIRQECGLPVDWRLN